MIVGRVQRADPKHRDGKVSLHTTYTLLHVDKPSTWRDHPLGKITWEVNVDEVLTIEEIQARYAPEWVLIGDPQPDESLQFRAGKVLFHSHDQDEVFRKAMEYPPGRYALRFLGSIPEDLVLIV